MSQAHSAVRLHIDDTQGKGRSIVLIHGWPLSGESWQAQIGPLRDAGYRVITYDRRGFGRSEKPSGGYDYDTLTADLAHVLESLDLRQVTLVGFSMGGGEVARYLASYGHQRIKSVVFAAAVPPYLLKTANNPDGPMSQELGKQWREQLSSDRAAFFEEFSSQFFSANGQLKVTQEQRKMAIHLAHQSDPAAALGCLKAFSTTDFRQDLRKITIPSLIIHGDADALVPFAGSGQRTHAAIPGSQLELIKDAPHGLTVSHAAQFNQALLQFLQH